MGELFRQYWLPAVRSDELPSPDCAPLRVMLLGEKLIAFRMTSGDVGLIADACPHRGASMFFGRNEEDGLPGRPPRGQDNDSLYDACHECGSDFHSRDC
jgi:phenylpropionate dioxygenase-like ring-hydroxylating dioxygenase large terminal subunit